jgi:hypothetical protein
MVALVRVTRERHPLAGLPLPVLGRMRRHGRVELLVVLPDGSKTLMPADWTDAQDGADPLAGDRGPTAATLGSLAELLHATAVLGAVAGRIGEQEGQAARQSPCQEDNRATYPAQSDARPAAGATGEPARSAPRRPARSRDRRAGRPDRQNGGGRIRPSGGGR